MVSHLFFPITVVYGYGKTSRFDDYSQFPECFPLLCLLFSAFSHTPRLMGQVLFPPFYDEKLVTRRD